jgi:Kef-type K+ transport system membrane component KefB
VLLRIIHERNYETRPVGAIAIACAAIGDATAWLLLGAIVAFVQSASLASVGLSLALGLAFAVLSVRFARPRLADVAIAPEKEGRWMVGLLLAILIGALFTEAIGLHALFGAFIAGIAVSRNVALRRLVEEKIEPFATVLLLPLFFANTGLVTRLDLLKGEEWLLCLGIVGVATLGKLGGTALAARASGMGGLDSLRLGSLMNTRGLMELIVLGLGFQLGLIEARLYAILVLVAIVTTAMTGPLLGLIDRIDARRAARSAQAPVASATP